MPVEPIHTHTHHLLSTHLRIHTWALYTPMAQVFCEPRTNPTITVSRTSMTNTRQTIAPSVKFLDLWSKWAYVRICWKAKVTYRLDQDQQDIKYSMLVCASLSCVYYDRNKITRNYVFSIVCYVYKDMLTENLLYIK